MIPVCTPLLGGNEKKYINDCLKTNWISSAGKYVQLFEENFSRYCGAKFGIATTSGTTALHLALIAAGISRGDEVIMPTFTIASPAFATIYCGAKPVFVDVQLDTWNIDPKKIEEKITKKTKAIIPVEEFYFRVPQNHAKKKLFSLFLSQYTRPPARILLLQF